MLRGENHESIYVTRHSSMGLVLHTCQVCWKPVARDAKALIHAFFGEMRFRLPRFPGGLFVCHWNVCAERAGLR